MESPNDWNSLEFLTLRVVCHDSTATHQLQFSFSYSGRGFWWFPCWIPALENQWAVMTCIFLSFSLYWFQWFALFPPVCGAKKCCWLVSLFGFLLAIRIAWQLPINSHAEPETRSPIVFCKAVLTHGPLISTISTTYKIHSVLNLEMQLDNIFS